jgi:hypothetical protein
MDARTGAVFASATRNCRQFCGVVVKTSSSRVLLVGELNPYGSEPEFALYCYPTGCAGYRLRRIFGLPEHEYLDLHRTNLCVGDWSKAQAKARVLELLSPDAPWRVIVLLGRKVTEAFEKVALDDVPLVAFSSRVCCPAMTIVSLPHPSGRNAALWNPKARDRAREIMRELAPELPWGSDDSETATTEVASA